MHEPTDTPLAALPDPVPEPIPDLEPELPESMAEKLRKCPVWSQLKSFKTRLSTPAPDPAPADASDIESLSTELDLIEFLRPTVHQESKLLNLPAELRLTIWEYALPEQTYEIVWLSKKAKTQTHWITVCPKQVLLRKVKHFDREEVARKMFHAQRYQPKVGKSTVARRRHFSLPHFRRPKPEPSHRDVAGPAALLLVSRQTHYETAAVLYGGATFSFSNMSLLRTFLDNLTPAAYQSLRQVHIHHDTWGEPYLHDHLVWKERYEAAWRYTLMKLCLARSLESLHMCIIPHGIPLLGYDPLPLWHLDIIKMLRAEALPSLKNFTVDIRINPINNTWTSFYTRFQAECIQWHVLGSRYADTDTFLELHDRLGKYYKGPGLHDPCPRESQMLRWVLRNKMHNRMLVWQHARAMPYLATNYVGVEDSPDSPWVPFSFAQQQEQLGNANANPATTAADDAADQAANEAIVLEATGSAEQ